MEQQDKQSQFQWRSKSAKALIPFIVFIFFYFGFSIITRDFSKIPMSVAFIISSTVALTLNHKEKLSKKIEIFSIGMGHKDIMLMCLIFILAGAFSATARAVGGVDAMVLIAQSFIPYKFMVSGFFIISALISLAIGTSCGTIAALVPIAVGLAESLGIPAGVLLGATVGGAMFGDNMSLISDTAIASARTQNVRMRDKMIYNLKVVIIPAVVTALIYTAPCFVSDSAMVQVIQRDFSFYIKIIPYILLLVLGIQGINVMFLLLLGTVLNIIIGIVFSSFDIFGAFTCVGDGTISMANTLVVALLAGGLLQMVRYNGGITYILDFFENFISGKKMCEFGICLLIGIINLFTANNTVAIITAGPIAKELSQKYAINPKRTASLLDTTSCCVQGLIPYGAQVLIAVSLSGGLAISAFSVLKHLYYPLLVGVAIICSILLKKTKNTPT